MVSVLFCGNALADEPITSNSNSDEKIHIIRDNTATITKGSPDYFTGDVSVARLFPANDPLQISGAYVTFAAGARTNWHTHPDGQLLIITEGVGWVQQWGGDVQEVKTGDVVWFPAGVKHWHGASADQSTTHIAMAKIIDSKSAGWLEKVTDDQYKK